MNTDVMVIITHIDKWDVTRVLVDSGSQAKIVPVGSITLPVSFGNPTNARTKFITFDVVNMYYPYNTIFGKCLPNTLEVVFHSTHLCLKVLALLGVISIYGS
jgi:hypothetical protein